jgi:biopolymer transport protein ExbD
MRRRSHRRLDSDQAEVAMSPLIDCVFLLLIFFLVTTMLKRKEKLIPVEMPNSTASVDSETRERELLIGLSRTGKILQPSSVRDRDGGIVWQPVADLSLYLKNFIDAEGVDAFTIPVQINADREVSFQKTIDILDLCKLQGFSNVSVKTRQQSPQGR